MSVWSAWPAAAAAAVFSDSALDDSYAADVSSSSSSSSSNGTSREDWEWGLGILLCLFGAACTNLGLTIQKYSFLRNDAKSPAKQKPAMNQPWWLLGMGIFMIGQILNLIAFGYTSQALAATLGSFSLVTNGVFAPLILGEKLTKAIVISIGVIVGGSVLVVLASSHAVQDYTLSELISLYEREMFIAYISALAIALVACLVIMWREDTEWERQKEVLAEWEKQQEARSLEFDPSIPTSSSSSSQESVSLKGSLQQDPEMEGRGVRVVVNNPNGNAPQSETAALIGERRDSPPAEVRVTAPSAITPIVAGAILSSCSVLFGKCTIQLLKASFESSNQFIYPLSWLLTAVFLTCAIMAVVYLNVGMRRGTALFVVPLYYVLNTVLAILGGLIYFEEFQHFTQRQGFLFALGVALTVIGVWVGSRGQVGDEGESGEEEELDVVVAESSDSDEEGSGGPSRSPPGLSISVSGAGGKLPAKSALSPRVGGGREEEEDEESLIGAAEPRVDHSIPHTGASAATAGHPPPKSRKKSVRFGDPSQLPPPLSRKRRKDAPPLQQLKQGWFVLPPRLTKASAKKRCSASAPNKKQRSERKRRSSIGRRSNSTRRSAPPSRAGVERHGMDQSHPPARPLLPAPPALRAARRVARQQMMQLARMPSSTSLLRSKKRSACATHSSPPRRSEGGSPWSVATVLRSSVWECRSIELTSSRAFPRGLFEISPGARDSSGALFKTSFLLCSRHSLVYLQYKC